MYKITSKLVLLLLSVLIFIFLWKVLQYVFNSFVPFNPMTELITFVLIVIMIPVSMISANLIFNMIKSVIKTRR